MSSRVVRRARLQVEALEDRYAPAAIVSPTELIYRDTDGDPVRVTFSKPILADGGGGIFLFRARVGGGGNLELLKIDLTEVPGAAGTDITVALDGTAVGDGKANVGFINAESVDLGKVIINGDLGRIQAGDDNDTTAALKKLHVDSIGVFGTATQDTGGNLVTTLVGPVGKIATAGDVKHALITVASANGELGLLKIGGSLIGGAEQFSGRVFAFGSIGEVRIGGDLIGGASGSGVIVANNHFGNITIGGSVTGGMGSGSGSFFTNGSTGAVAIGGSVIGASGPSSGTITAGQIGSMAIAGNLVAGTGGKSGSIRATGKIGDVSIGGNIDGTTTGEEFSASIEAAKIRSILVGGNVLGGSGQESGHIVAQEKLGSLTIHGTIVSGVGVHSGWVHSEGNIGDIHVGGLIFGVSIVAAGNLGHITAGGIVGSPNARVIIAAGGGFGEPASIASLTVSGSVFFADILAGYDATEQFGPVVRTNANARIGPVIVGNDWVAGNLVAGVDRGADGFFGTADDGAIVAGSPEFISKIGAVTIGGMVNGSIPGGDGFGIVAELVKALSINGSTNLLGAGPRDDIGLALLTNGNTNDFILTELEA